MLQLSIEPRKLNCVTLFICIPLIFKLDNFFVFSTFNENFGAKKAIHVYDSVQYLIKNIYLL